MARPNHRGGEEDHHRRFSRFSKGRSTHTGSHVERVGCVGFVALVRLFNVLRRNKQNQKEKDVYASNGFPWVYEKEEHCSQIQLGYLENRKLLVLVYMLHVTDLVNKIKMFYL